MKKNIQTKYFIRLFFRSLITFNIRGIRNSWKWFFKKEKKIEPTEIPPMISIETLKCEICGEFFTQHEGKNKINVYCYECRDIEFKVHNEIQIGLKEWSSIKKTMQTLYYERITNG